MCALHGQHVCSALERSPTNNLNMNETGLALSRGMPWAICYILERTPASTMVESIGGLRARYRVLYAQPARVAAGCASGSRAQGGRCRGRRLAAGARPAPALADKEPEPSLGRGRSAARPSPGTRGGARPAHRRGAPCGRESRPALRRSPPATGNILTASL